MLQIDVRTALKVHTATRRIAHSANDCKLWRLSNNCPLNTGRVASRQGKGARN